VIDVEQGDGDAADRRAADQVSALPPDLAELSDISVAPKPVERMARKIGKERTDQRDATVDARKRLPRLSAP